MLEVHILRALKDNYVYVIRCSKTDKTAVIDPSDSAPVLQFLESRGWKLDAIFNTHHHYDHVGGNEALKNKYQCEIYCSLYDRYRIPRANHFLSDLDHFQFGASPVTVWHIPGHTLGAISYNFTSDKIVFTGDTLFTLGCGRLFEGSFEQMYSSLNRLKSLPDDFKVYSGHEYGWVNGQFALAQNPPPQGLEDHLASLKQQLLNGDRSVPSLLSHEKQWNPFLTARNLEEFTHLRRLKDDFVLEDRLRIG